MNKLIAALTCLGALATTVSPALAQQATTDLPTFQSVEADRLHCDQGSGFGVWNPPTRFGQGRMSAALIINDYDSVTVSARLIGDPDQGRVFGWVKTVDGQTVGLVRGSYRGQTDRTGTFLADIPLRINERLPLGRITGTYVDRDGDDGRLRASWNVCFEG